MSTSARNSAPGSAPNELAPRGCTNLKLRQITRRVSRHYDAAVGASGLKTTQYSLLSFVASLGPIRPSDLAAKMNLDASTLTRNLQPLVAQGFIELGPGENARSRLIAITEGGRATPVERASAVEHTTAVDCVIALERAIAVERAGYAAANGARRRTEAASSAVGPDWSDTAASVSSPVTFDERRAPRAAARA